MLGSGAAFNYLNNCGRGCATSVEEWLNIRLKSLNQIHSKYQHFSKILLFPHNDLLHWILRGHYYKPKRCNIARRSVGHLCE